VFILFFFTETNKTLHKIKAALLHRQWYLENSKFIRFKLDTHARNLS